MPSLPSWDIFIGLTFLVGIGYGFILRRDKTITLLCSTYIGLVIASSFSEDIFQFFNGNKVIANQIWIRSNAPISTIAIVLFVASVILIAGAINSSSNRTGDISPIEVVAYSALSMAIIITSVIGFLPEPARLHCLEVSTAARYLFAYKSLLLVAGPLSLIILNFRRK